MAYVNVGSFVYGKRPASKKALREAIRDFPGSVNFDSTAMGGPRGGDYIVATVEDIGTDKLSVTGPDPYTSRKWYATVQVKNGKVTVS